MAIGAFSISLDVADVRASRDFYAHLGFSDMGGDPDQGWLILTNGSAVIGLFQKMLGKNTLTFNPGWDQVARPVADFEDVRAIQARLKAAGVALTSETDPEGTGPAHIALVDPDGNPVLIDQHVPAP